MHPLTVSSQSVIFRLFPRRHVCTTYSCTTMRANINFCQTDLTLCWRSSPVMRARSQAMIQRPKRNFQLKSPQLPGLTAMPQVRTKTRLTAQGWIETVTQAGNLTPFTATYVLWYYRCLLLKKQKQKKNSPMGCWFCLFWENEWHTIYEWWVVKTDNCALGSFYCFPWLAWSLTDISAFSSIILF